MSAGVVFFCFPPFHGPSFSIPFFSPCIFSLACPVVVPFCGGGLSPPVYSDLGSEPFLVVPSPRHLVVSNQSCVFILPPRALTPVSQSSFFRRIDSPVAFPRLSLFGFPSSIPFTALPMSWQCVCTAVFAASQIPPPCKPLSYGSSLPSFAAVQFSVFSRYWIGLSDVFASVRPRRTRFFSRLWFAIGLQLRLLRPSSSSRLGCSYSRPFASLTLR